MNAVKPTVAEITWQCGFNSQSHLGKTFRDVTSPTPGIYRNRSAIRGYGPDSEYWSQIIRTAAWRYTLIGCTCVLIARPDDRFEDLLYRFERGSFVSPQLSIAMGMVYPKSAIESLNSFLDRNSREGAGQKELISAQSVLRALGTPCSNPLRADSLQSRARQDAEFVEQLIEKQWAFWTRYHREQ
ncbi:hypothetical protein IQ256_28530 [cf. Phormidesmis sp. LEGE 11477]|nr:hypothetical protein [cf. Phormidesmis sp. LEGE 11477]